MSVTLPKKENAMENNGMITLTKAEMLEEWKKRKGFYSGVRSCDVEREDGVDLDGVLQREMDDWYNKMLREAPSEMLPIENIAKDCLQRSMPAEPSQWICQPGVCGCLR